MVIEFKTSMSNHEEQHNRMIMEETTGLSSVPFHSDKDYIGTCALDMTRVIEYVEGTVWHNDVLKNCVYAINDVFDTSRNLLITVVEFKEIFERAKGIKVFDAETLLND